MPNLVKSFPLLSFFIFCLYILLFRFSFPFLDCYLFLYIVLGLSIVHICLAYVVAPWLSMWALCDLGVGEEKPCFRPLKKKKKEEEIFLKTKSKNRFYVSHLFRRVLYYFD